MRRSGRTKKGLVNCIASVRGGKDAVYVVPNDPAVSAVNRVLRDWSRNGRCDIDPTPATLIGENLKHLLPVTTGIWVWQLTGAFLHVVVADRRSSKQKLVVYLDHTIRD